MRHIDPETLTAELLDLADRAGQAILEIYAQADPARTAAGSGDPLVAYKANESPLTLADLASHDVICAGLRRLAASVPVVSEEDDASLDDRKPQGDFWLIDPLDGTKEFLARNDEFTVNIAFVRDGAPIWGVVFAPALGQMYWGGRGRGARRRASASIEPIRVATPVPPGGPYRVVASKSHLNAETSDFIARLENVELVQAGSSLKFCRIAEGLADVYPRLAPTCEWDTAAAQAVVEGAGGSVTDLQGVRLRYGKAEVLNPHFIAASQPLAALS